MPIDDELNLDPLDNDDDALLIEDDDASPSVDDDEDEPQHQRRGNPAVALQAERQKRREMEERLREMELQHARTQALLERTGQPQQDPRAYEEYNQRLAEQLLENPSGVLQYHQQQAEARFNQKLASLQAPTMVEKHVKANPAYRAVLEAAPEVREGLETMVHNGLVSGLDEETLDDQVSKAFDLFAKVAGANKASAVNPAKHRASSIVDGGQRVKARSPEQIWEQQKALSKKGPQGAKQFLDWAKTPEGRKVAAALTGEG